MPVSIEFDNSHSLHVLHIRFDERISQQDLSQAVSTALDYLAQQPGPADVYFEFDQITAVPSCIFIAGLRFIHNLPANTRHVIVLSNTPLLDKLISTFHKLYHAEAQRLNCVKTREEVYQILLTGQGAARL